ncbi:methylenetetrahydrofolate reductase [NAD(P)H] [Tunicatimonas pelagia]|uniref:methylenetetrahydrofolate reductase [NAD(P)H] n=1 Tax=Tunicatimonas pelagia TaxID=931531 RepID=UPI002664E4F9|nr:methylenetetrahydrofolate reductase [NAD(P)H] [Tunicatimonas pelagia]WKN44755.1 methylenetetrahydrofolate reductase [NAD(P)H] [Tunicatimonas pelagia]
MKVIEHIAKATDTLFTIEILPPKKGEDIQTLFSHIDSLMEFKPAFIDVTYHREEHVYKEMGDGMLKKYVTRKRPGTVGICAAIQNRYNVDTVPHVICGGFSQEDTENMLIDLDFLGIQNVLVLRGDPVKSESGFVPHPEGHCYANELIEQIAGMNQGKYLYDEGSATPTNFCIGAAGYPEKHFESPNLGTDLQYLKNKVEAGAEFIVTQMFFDNQVYFNFVELCRANGIDVPIIPGLKPLVTIKHLTALPKYFFLDIPEALRKEVAKCKDNKQAREVGIEWCVQQCQELKAAGVPCLHFYTMSKSEMVRRVAEQVF